MLKNIKYYIKRFFNSRIGILIGLFSLFLVIMIARIFYLQIIQKDYYLNNYIQKTAKTVYSEGTRGNIYDVNGKLLAYDELSYSVAIEGGYAETNEELNDIVLRTIKIIEKNKDKLVSDFPIIADSDGNLIYSTTSNSTITRFLINIFGLKKAELIEQGLDKCTAQEAFDYLCSEDKYEVDDSLKLKTKLKLLSVRYNLSLNYYQQYIDTTIAREVSDATVAAIYENSAELPGVSIIRENQRKYNYGIYMGPILGYTGQISEDEIEILNENNDKYEYKSGDIIGKSGLEEYLDLYLRGEKGEEEVIVDSLGTVLKQEVKSEAKTGNDVYLSIDVEAQQAAYHLLEQKIAGILLSRIVNYDYKPSRTDSIIKIPIKDVYFQMINNNIVDLSALNADKASANEKNIYNKFINKRDSVTSQIKKDLLNEDKTPLNYLSDEYNDYMWYIYKMLKEPDVDILSVSSIDVEDETYLAFTNEEISFSEFLRYAIKCDWVKASNIKNDERFSDSDTLYEALVDYIYNYISDNTGFAKRVYYYMIYNGSIGGNEVCRLLYDQKILPYDEGAYNSLGYPGNAYSWMIDKLTRLEITPAMVALDPCSGSVCLTNVDTGRVIAMVTYPGYDNNYLSGTVDTQYWNKLTNDLSLPLYNNATQTRTAPGSTFKMCTAIAGMENGVISEYSTIYDHGMFKEITPSPKCWIYPGSHGEINVHGALAGSCNYYFYTVGYRLGSQSGSYSSLSGLNAIGEYAKYLGLTDKSGVEVSENAPHFSDENAVTTAIGQGSNTFSNIQLNRYVTAIANGGTTLNLTLLEKAVDKEGNILDNFVKEPLYKDVISETSINAVKTGMREVITSGTASGTFAGVNFTVAGKTGTAQENMLRSDHATFVGFAPYENPEVSVSVVIPFGDSSSYSAELARDVLKFYFNDMTLKNILKNGASVPTSNVVRD